jgi:hypothetical protein
MLKETIEQLAQDFADGILQAIRTFPLGEVYDVSPDGELEALDELHEVPRKAHVKAVAVARKPTKQVSKIRSRKPVARPTVLRAVASYAATSPDFLLTLIPTDHARRSDKLAAAAKMSASDVRAALAPFVESGRVKHEKVDDTRWGYRRATESAVA